jgi:hypothetical protein
MGPRNMSELSSFKQNETLLAVLKLHDDGSNWPDYEPRLKKAMGAKGIWKHVLGTAYRPRQYNLVNGKYLLDDGTVATEAEIEAKEVKIDEYEQRDYLAQHVLLSMTSM